MFMTGNCGLVPAPLMIINSSLVSSPVGDQLVQSFQSSLYPPIQVLTVWAFGWAVAAGAGVGVGASVGVGAGVGVGVGFGAARPEPHRYSTLTSPSW